MTQIAILDLRGGCIREEVNFESPPIVMIDQAPNRLHPVVILKERRYVADTQRRVGCCHAAWRVFRGPPWGELAFRPGAPRIEYGLIVVGRASGDDQGNCPLWPCRIASGGGLAEQVQRRIHLPQLE